MTTFGNSCHSGSFRATTLENIPFEWKKSCDEIAHIEMFIPFASFEITSNGNIPQSNFLTDIDNKTVII